jgi:hypothetical protein
MTQNVYMVSSMIFLFSSHVLPITEFHAFQVATMMIFWV